MALQIKRFQNLSFLSKKFCVENFEKSKAVYFSFELLEVVSFDCFFLIVFLFLMKVKLLLKCPEMLFLKMVFLSKVFYKQICVSKRPTFNMTLKERSKMNGL